MSDHRAGGHATGSTRTETGNLRKSLALVHERTPGGFLQFRQDAIHNWCEIAPVLNAVYDRLESPVKRS